MLRDGGPAHSCSALQEALDLRLIRSYVFDMNGIFHTPKRFALLLLAAFALANGPRVGRSDACHRQGRR